MRRAVLRVGLTGGIATGKSHVLRRLGSHGVAGIDLDAVAHAVMAPGGAAYDDVVAAFGSGVVSADRTIDRKALGAIAFRDPSARARLEALVHPRVREVETRRARELQAEGTAVVVSEAALLVEAGAHLRFDRLVVVHCAPPVQLARLRARDRLDEAAARARLEAQMPLDEKRGFGHFEVDTSGSLEETDARVDALAGELLEAAGRASADVEVPSSRLLAMAAAAPAVGPRGLSASVLLDAIARGGGFDMDRLASRLSPPAEGPWYRAAAGAAPGAPATALAPALVAWRLARGSADVEYLVAAAASLARLTHLDPSPRCDACLYTLVLQSAAITGLPDDLVACARRLAPLAIRWGGGAPSGVLDRVWEMAGEARARGGAGSRPDAAPEAALAAALVGAGRGTAVARAPSELVAAVERIRAGSH